MSTLNVISFGATGNGTTNDTAAQQSALNAAIAGDTVLWPAGTYQTNQLTIPIGGITLQIVGTIRKIIGSTNGPMIAASGKNNLTIFGGGTLDGQGTLQSWWDANPYTNTSTATNLQIASCSGTVISNIRTIEASQCGWLLTDCTSFTVSSVASVGCGLASQTVNGTSANGTIMGCASNLCYSDGFTISGTDITLTDCDGSNARFNASALDQFAGFYTVSGLRISFVRCTGHGNSNRTFDFDNINGSGTINCTLSDCAGYSNVHQGLLTGTSGFVVSRCRFWDNGDAGISVRGTNHTFNDCAVHAVIGTQTNGFTGVGTNTKLTNCDVRANTSAGINASLSGASGFSNTGLAVSDSNYPGLYERNNMVLGSAF